MEKWSRDGGQPQPQAPPQQPPPRPAVAGLTADGTRCRRRTPPTAASPCRRDLAGTARRRRLAHRAAALECVTAGAASVLIARHGRRLRHAAWRGEGWPAALRGGARLEHLCERDGRRCHGSAGVRGRRPAACLAPGSARTPVVRRPWSGARGQATVVRPPWSGHRVLVPPGAEHAGQRRALQQDVDMLVEPQPVLGGHRVQVGIGPAQWPDPRVS